MNYSSECLFNLSNYRFKIVIVHILNRNKYGLSVLLYNLYIKESSTYAFIL